MKVLVTGASGFLGTYLIPELQRQAHQVVALVHRAPVALAGVTSLSGDVTKPDFGWKEMPDEARGLGALVNCASIVSFQERAQPTQHLTNVLGAEYAARFCVKQGVPLYHISTVYIYHGDPEVYAAGVLHEVPIVHRGAFRNYYEQTKYTAEAVLRTCNPNLQLSIIRPSILIGDSQVHGVPALAGYYAAVRAVYLAKRWLERVAKLPPLEPAFRVSGDPAETLNIIPVDLAAKQVSELVTARANGIFHVVNENPPNISDLMEAAGHVLGARLVADSDFVHNPAEHLIERMAKELIPYMRGALIFDNANTRAVCATRCTGVSLEFIEATTRHFLMNHNAGRV